MSTPAGSVGTFQQIMQSMARKTTRADVNPMDKATIVSIYPKEIDEFKATIQPGRFIIPAGSVNRPSILVVGPSSWWREIDEDQPLLEIPVSSILIADSIVKDYCNGLFACNMGDIMPGLFYVAGEHSLKDIIAGYSKQLAIAAVKQKNFWAELVKAADALWARSEGNPLAISDDMRLAAKELGVADNKDWMKDFKAVSMERCFACGALKNPEYPVCSSCRAIDPKHPMADKIKFSA